MVLTERQRFVLTRRYGLDDGEFRTCPRSARRWACRASACGRSSVRP
jgi:hypothetical protein